MRLARSSAALLLAGAVLAAPAGASVEVPAYCGRNPKFLSTLPEGAELVEKTLYFHGRQPSGDVGVRVNVDDTFMDANPPTAAVPKEKINLGGGANAASNKNSLTTYWVGDLVEPERIVCAELEFTAADSETFSTSLWIDQPRGTDGSPAASSVAITPGGGEVNTYSGSFGRSLDVEATSEIVVQVLAATAAPVLYDAVGTAGSFTYLTVVE